MKKIFLFAFVTFGACACGHEIKHDNTGSDSTVTAADADSLNKTNMDTSRPQDIVITRIFDAPISALWKAWTDPKMVEKWWSPKFYSGCPAKIDLKIGGRFVFCMRSPKEEGSKEMYSAGTYSEIKKDQLLAFTQQLSDKDGSAIDPASLNMPPDFPKEIPTTVTFKMVDGKTELTVTEFGWRTGQMRTYSEMGMIECLDKLAALLIKK